MMVGLYLIGPISQQQTYHNFADTRAIFGIPNFYDVISSGAYILVGAFGILSIRRSNSPSSVNLPTPNLIFFCFTILIGFGSAYYHLEPNDKTLFWDRLPMSVAFMAFFTVVIGQYISLNAAKLLLIPMCALGVISVLYWQLPYGNSTGDLRPYVGVQFIPMLLIPLILLTSSRQSLNTAIWGLLLFYVLAKVAEYFDDFIFSHTGIFSGHTLKHLLSAVGILWYALNSSGRWGTSRQSSLHICLMPFIADFII